MALRPLDKQPFAFWLRALRQGQAEAGREDRTRSVNWLFGEVRYQRRSPMGEGGQRAELPEFG